MSFRFASLARALSLSAALVGLSAAESTASATTMKTLYIFCTEANCTDGSEPMSGLLTAQSGVMYGSTYGGGAHGYGTIYEMIPQTNGGWDHQIIWNFDAAKGIGPRGNLVLDTAGDIYGTAAAGGLYGGGVAFELMPNAERRKWKIRILHNFCRKGGQTCDDGGNPEGGLNYAGSAFSALYDRVSPLYGTTSQGGRNGAPGVLFKLVPAETGKWNEKVLYTFCNPGDSCPSESNPFYDTPTFDISGNVLGTLAIGGKSNGGVVYSFGQTQNPTRTLTTLYNFCSVAGAVGCLDGSAPEAGVIRDTAGNLYGMTTYGGVDALRTEGVVYKLTPAGPSSWQETILHVFCQTVCSDGAGPVAPLIQDANGVFYGTTQYGGVNGSDRDGGTVFKLNGTTETVLYSFCAQKSCADGKQPFAPLALDAAGNLFGTTSQGGSSPLSSTGGTVFEVLP